VNLLDILTGKDFKIITDHEYDSAYIKERSDSVAAYLHSQGLGSNSRVAIEFPNGVDFIISFLSVLKIGATVLIFNPKWPAYIKQEITFDFLLSSLENIKQEQFNSSGTSTKIVLYTSGSTGLPKAVSIDCARHSRLIEQRARTTSSEIRKIISSPLCHMSALSNLETSMAAGHTVILLEKFTSDDFEKQLIDHSVNQIHIIPSMMRNFLQMRSTVFPKVRSILLGAEVVDEKLYRDMCKAFPNAKISTAYGSTELGPNVFGQHPQGLKTPPGSVGYPNPDIEYRIVDGILEVKSPYMMIGYENNDQRFTEDGFYITGDLFEIDELGFYYCLGAAGNVFKSNGNKIYPSKIESIIQSHPAIKNVAVIPIPDEIKGSSFLAVISTYETVRETEIIDFCVSKMMRYEVPKKFLFVENLPLNSVGKIDRKELECLIKPQL
jgi:long-chain acyl-CoA synthetase